MASIGYQTPGRFSEQLDAGEEIHLENTAQPGFVQFVRRRLETVAGVGIHHVEPAESPLGRIQHARRHATLGHVAAHQFGVAAARAYGGGDLCQGLLAPTIQNHVHAGFSASACRRGPDSAAGPGDHNNLVGQIATHESLPHAWITFGKTVF